MSALLAALRSSTVQCSGTSRSGRGQLLPALLTLLALCFAPAAHSDQAVLVRAGLHDGFGRLVLEWPTPVAVAGRQDGSRYRLRFGRPLEAALDAAVAHLRDYLVRARLKPDGQELVLDLAPGVMVRQHITKGRIVVLDLAPAAPMAAADEVEVRTGRHDGFGRLVFEWPVPVTFDADTAGREVAIRFDRAGTIGLANVTARLGAWLQNASASRSSGRSMVRLELQPDVAARVFRVDDHRVVVDLSAAPAHTTADVAAAQPQPAAGAPAPSISAPAARAAPAPVAPPPGNGASARLTIASGARDEGAYVDFAWTRPVAAAVFLRGGHLWAVFAAETERPEDLAISRVGPSLHNYLGRGERVEASGGTAIRFALHRPLAVDVRRLDQIWRVRLSVEAPAPQAVYPRRVSEPARLRLAPGESPQLVALRDPEVGDRLTVWPLLQANLGQPRQRFVDLELLATVQGLAWRLRNDAVQARMLDDAVEFGAPGGLILSGHPDHGSPGLEVATEPPDEAIDVSPPAPAPERMPAAEPVAATLEPPPPEPGDGLLEASAAPALGLVGWGLSPAYTAPERRTALQEALAQATADERDAHRLDLARYYVSKALAAEALGVLGTVAQPEDAAIGQARQALRGAADLLMGRVDAAAAALGAPALDEDPEVALWRAAIAASRQDWPEAVRQLERSDQVLATYPRPLRLRLGLLAARAAIEAGDAALASVLLEQLGDAGLAPGERARLAFLIGVASARDGATRRADETWQTLEHDAPGDVRIDAAFARTKLLLEAGELDPAAALARLAPTRGLWRGHPREERMLAALAQIHLDAGDRPGAIRTWKELLDRYPATGEAPAIARRMRDTLLQALLAEDDAALGSLQAYALFREFAELIPENELGDGVRRRMAERLAELDLIRPAAALLGPLASDRLRGVERATAGADLAALWLREPAPQQALTALDRSQVDEVLPPALDERRRILEAEALVRSRRRSAALDLLDGLETPTADDLRVDILWQEHDWPRLIVAIEGALGRRQGPSSGLDEREQAMVLKLAIAHGRLGQSAALERVRARFAAALRGQALEPAFLLATTPPEAADQPEEVLAAAEQHLRRVRAYLEAAPATD